MAALTKNRDSVERPGALVQHPAAAAVRLFQGAIGCLDAAGNAVPGSTSTTLTAIGRVESEVDNSSGAAGDKEVVMKRGLFKFANDAGDTIDRTHIGGNAYIVDDQTVAATDGGATRSVAGQIEQVDSDGVWIKFG